MIGIVGAIAASILVFTVPQFEGGLDKDGGSTGYRDTVGIPTKCSGDTHDVVVGQKYTSAECRESLQTQLINHAEGVLKCTPILKNQFYQLAAAVSFAYNEGISAYCNSTIAKRFRAGDNKGACKQFNESDSGKPQWISAKGKVLPGLIIRRAKERQLCETGL